MPILGAYCVTMDKERCISWNMPGKCSTCVEVCPNSVFSTDDMGRVYVLNDLACVGCRICIANCPNNVIHIRPAESERFSRGLWTFQAIEEVHYKAETGKYLLRGFGTMGLMPHFDDLVIVPAQLYPPAPKDKYREECRMDVVIGEGRVKKPLKLKIPVMFAAMSYGAISREAKIALAIATAKMGIAACTGEGGSFPEEYYLVHGYKNEEDFKHGKKTYKPGGQLIVQWASGRWGVSIDYLNRSDAIEIKIGQGAKPGMGGHLLGEKVTEEIAKIRGIPVGTDCLSPCRHYDIYDVKEDLKKQIELLRDVTDYEKPIIVKLGPGRVYKDVKLAAEAGADAIAIDGTQGGTGAAPEMAIQAAGIPTIGCIPLAVRALEDLGLRDEVKIIAMGGIRNGADAVKALALGADCVAIASAALIAMGCRVCTQCLRGKCPYGITSQDPELRKRLQPEKAAERLVNFLKAMAEEIKMLTMLSGHDDIHQLSKEDLRALDVNVAAITGVKLVGLEKYILEK